MDIVTRAKNICLTPNTEWPVIAAEATPPGTLITEYVVPLAAIGAVAGFIGGSLVGTSFGFGYGTFRVPLDDRLDDRHRLLRDGDRRLLRHLADHQCPGADIRRHEGQQPGA